MYINKEVMNKVNK